MKRILVLVAILICMYPICSIAFESEISCILAPFDGILYNSNPRVYYHQAQHIAFQHNNQIDLITEQGMVNKTYSIKNQRCFYYQNTDGSINGCSYNDSRDKKKYYLISILDLKNDKIYDIEYAIANLLGVFIYSSTPPTFIESRIVEGKCVTKAINMSDSSTIWEKTNDNQQEISGSNNVIFSKSNKHIDNITKHTTSIIDPFTGNFLITIDEDMKLWYENKNYVILYQEFDDYDKRRFIVINRSNWQIITDFTQYNCIIIDGKQDFIKATYKDTYQDSQPKTSYTLEWVNQFGIAWKKQEILLDRHYKPVGKVIPKIVVVGDYVGYITNEQKFQIVCINNSIVEYESTCIYPNVTTFGDRIWLHSMSTDKTKWIERFFDSQQPEKYWSIEHPINSGL